MRMIKVYYTPDKKNNWELFIDGKDYSDSVPIGYIARTQCYNIYSGEVMGLPYNSWIAQNGWVWDLPALPQDIYAAFQIEEQSILST